MKTFKYNSEKFDQLLKNRIIDQANEREFYINTKLGKFQAKIAGTKLEFPYIYDNLHLGITSEISWNLAQRIAEGTVKTIEI